MSFSRFVGLQLIIALSLSSSSFAITTNPVPAIDDKPEACETSIFENLKSFVFYSMTSEICILQSQTNPNEDSINEKKEDFLKTCVSTFKAECPKNLPIFINPDIEKITKAGRAYCEKLLEDVLGWQCPFESAQALCEKNYEEDLEKCEKKTSTIAKAACKLSAFNKRKECYKNPPGYPGPLGGEDGPPDYNKYFCNIKISAVPACIGAFLPGGNKKIIK